MDLNQRIQRLERSNRLLKLVAGAALAVAIGVPVVGFQTKQPVLDSVVAHNFEVVDEHGVPVVMLFAGENGGMVVTGSNDPKADSAGAVLACRKSGGELMMFSEHGKSEAALAARAEGGGLTLQTPTEKIAVDAGVTEHGNGKVFTVATDTGDITGTLPAVH